MAKRLMKVLLTVLLSLCSLFMLTGVALTATFTVNTTNDTVDVVVGDGNCADSNGECSLRAAIMEANAFPGADTIHVPSGRYILALDPVDGFDDSAAGGDLDITGDLTLIGAGAETTIIDGDNKYQVFHTRATVTLSGITVTRGYQGCGDGGGILNADGALTIADSIITGNSANQCGSTGGSGGGICNDGYYKNAQLTIINSTVSNNVARGSNPLGGGIVSGKQGSGTVTLTINNSTITGNNAGQWGGGGYGGGIANLGGTLEIMGSVISNNGAHSGGGVRIWQEGDTITITDSTISGNTAWNLSGGWSGSGGGIFALVNNLTITNSTISGNATSYGAEGGHSAAGIQIQQGNVTIANSTVSGNNASRTDVGMTGGIINGGALTVISSTITNNRGSVGGIHRIAGTVMLSNTIIANQAVGPNCSGTITSNGYNLASDSTCGLNATGDISNGTANLGPLADNGGKTLTHALLSGSQAINAGNNAECTSSSVNGKDQRGFSRWDGTCDIGAFEAVTLYLLNVTTGGTGNGFILSSPGKIDCPDICTDQIGENTVVTLTATPNRGSSFTNWCGDCFGTNRTVQVTVNTAKNCTAVFSIHSPMVDKIINFDEDKKSDITIYRASNGGWFVLPSGGGTPFGVGWGGDPSDIPVPGDYDGDGKTDIAVYRGDNGGWYIIPSGGGSPYGVGWGGDPSDIPVPGDYDGDGKTDIAVYRGDNGGWYIIPSGGVCPYGVGWGGEKEDIPVPGDYDGDGKADIAIYRKSNGGWYVIPSGETSPYGLGWGGESNDKPIPDDYDGDGKTDVAVYRANHGFWFVIPSSGASPYGIGWGGESDDKPVPGDYDGDGKTGYAIYRSGPGTWYILPSGGGNVYGLGWGGDSSDIPVTMNLSAID
ncbi:MAG: VCBS repeat-containing protein [Candidatus Methanosuratincola sp.]